MTHTHKVALTIGTAVLLFSVIVGAFWWEDWRYLQPTPRPANLQQVPLGQTVSLGSMADALPVQDRTANGKPLFLHFFNPGCPCSRFNLTHLRSLVKNYGQKARFVAVLQGDEPQKLKDGFARTGLNMESVVDEDGRLARKLGVYSTPQAVILGADGALVYRGNYNSARFCSAKQSEYARIALEAHLQKKPAPALPRAAMVAYGCPLPSYFDLQK